MKDIFVEQLFVLINPVWDSLPVHTMTEFLPNSLLKISLNVNMYVDTGLAVSSIMSGWVGTSKNNLASIILESTKKKKKSSSEMLGESFHFVDQNKNVAR